MLAFLVCAASLTFTPADFEGLKVPVFAPPGPVSVNGAERHWEVVQADPSGTSETPKDAMKPYYWVRITDLSSSPRQTNEMKALSARLNLANSVRLISTMRRITLAKIGLHHLIVQNGNAVDFRRNKSVYFAECFFYHGKKLYEYRFVSTDSSEAEKAMAALKALEFKSGEENLTAEGVPEGVEGEYSYGGTVSVYTPIVPTRLADIGPDNTFRQWMGTIGDPDKGGSFLEFYQLGLHSQSDTEIGFLRSVLVRLGRQAAEPPPIREIIIDHARLDRSKSDFLIGSSTDSEDVLTGTYKRIGALAGILVQYGKSRSQDNRIRLLQTTHVDLIRKFEKGLLDPGKGGNLDH